MRSSLPTRYRPRPAPGVEAYPVFDQMVLVRGEAPDPEIVALNETGRAIWELCDGNRSLEQIGLELASAFAANGARISADLTNLILRLRDQGFLEITAHTVLSSARGDGSSPDIGPPEQLRLLFGVEDRPYFHWQLGILFESLVGQLPPEWRILVVVCNDDRPLSPRLQRLFDVYGVDWAHGSSPADRHSMDWAAGEDRYVALNRIEALRVASALVEPQELVCLMDTDVFLFGDLDESVFPSTDALAANWLLRKERFFSGPRSAAGVDLPKLLEAIGCRQTFLPGAVTVFVTGATLTGTSLVRDCFRFTQVLYLLGRTQGHSRNDVWVAEMACFALAMTAGGIPYRIVDDPRFVVSENASAPPSPGTFFHYYAEYRGKAGGGFHGSRWHKQLFHDRDFLLEDVESFLEGAESEIERSFFELARRASRRLDDDEP